MAFRKKGQRYLVSMRSIETKDKSGIFRCLEGFVDLLSMFAQILKDYSINSSTGTLVSDYRHLSSVLNLWFISNYHYKQWNIYFYSKLKSGKRSKQQRWRTLVIASRCSNKVDYSKKGKCWSRISWQICWCFLLHFNLQDKDEPHSLKWSEVDSESYHLGCSINNNPGWLSPFQDLGKH